MRGKVIIIQGGQYGSEGKGAVAAEIAWRRGVTHAVRTGSINAGHTVYKDGRKFVMQIIPTAWVNPGTTLVLGAGCYIEPQILQQEITNIKDATGEDITKRLIIDRRCVWFGGAEAQRAKDANRHHAMGATGKGCSEAIVSKIYDRGDISPESRLFTHKAARMGMTFNFADTVKHLDEVLNRGEHILLEGTQGALLDFNTGPYPYVTSRMTNAAAWLAEAGLPPVNVETILVVRTYPIRVAGNSGPLADEIDWPELARAINRKLGRESRVSETDIQVFEAALSDVVAQSFPEVMSDASIAPEDKIRFHKWTPHQRVVHRVCVSEANAAALRKLSNETLAGLAFFEKTTVTKKLRRVARLNIEDVREAIRMNGPTSIALTFLNYEIPQVNNLTAEGLNNSHESVRQQVDEYVGYLSSVLGVPISMVTTGPLPENHINV